MKWTFARVRGETYYFGEMNGQNAQGYGLFVHEMQMSFYGQWDCGELKHAFVESEEIEIPDKDYRVVNPEIIYDKFEVFNQIRDFPWDITKRELLFTKYESCKLNIQGDSDNKEFKVVFYDLNNLCMINQILKHIHLAFFLSVYPQMLNHRFMSVNFSSRNLQFYLVTNYYEDPVQVLKKLDNQQRISMYYQLLEGLKSMHEKKISPDNISPYTVVATKHSNGQNILAINDFTKAKIILSLGERWVKSILTRDRGFRAPEIYSMDKYDPFQSYIFSIILTICAFEKEDFSIGENIVNYDDLIGKVKAIPGFITIQSIRACLKFEPSSRPNIKELIFKRMTTDL